MSDLPPGWTHGWTIDLSDPPPPRATLDPAVVARLRELVGSAQTRLQAADAELRDAEELVREQLAAGMTVDAIAGDAGLTLDAVQRVADGGRILPLG